LLDPSSRSGVSVGEPHLSKGMVRGGMGGEAPALVSRAPRVLTRSILDPQRSVRDVPCGLIRVGCMMLSCGCLQGLQVLHR